MSKKEKQSTTATPSNVERRRKIVENTAVFGLILVAVGLMVPFANLTSPAYVAVFKWIYSAGALVYLAARVADVRDPRESLRLRRLRRLEVWAGVALCIAAFFWFYNENRYGARSLMTLSVLRDTIIFTLVGAIVQLIASWMIYAREKREKKGNTE